MTVKYYESMILKIPENMKIMWLSDNDNVMKYILSLH